MKKFLVTLLTLSALIFSQVADASFSDITISNPNYDAINYVQSQGIVKGYPDGTFKPYNNINRAEFTKIIMNATFPASQISGGNCFSDVTDQWFAPYICTAENKGIVSGYANNTFGPADNIKFVEAAKIIDLAFNYNVDSSSDSSWYAPYVKKLSDVNAIPTQINGFAQDLTRGEMAEMIYRLKDNIQSKPSMKYEENNNQLVTQTQYKEDHKKQPQKNSAEQYCLSHGGSLSNQGNTEYCVFYNGSDCKIWDFYSGVCTMKPNPPSPITPEQYCRNNGGYVNAGFCVFSNGSQCTLQSFFNGTCHMQPNPTPSQYCENNGGKVTWLNGDHVCVFSSSYCDLEQFFEKTCHKGDHPNTLPGNPASIYCTNNGGKSEMDGSTRYCVFPDGGKCEEWAYYKGTCSDTPPIGRGGENPASVYCTQQGGTLQMDGSTGYCIFPDGGKCEEWAYYKGTCSDTPPIGKGTENPASKFCTDNGGTYSLDGSTGYCTFADGSKCEEWAFYNGKCKDTPTPVGPVIGGKAGENPASAYCTKNGGTLNTSDSTGYCQFDDNSECEEWAYYNGKCKKGDNPLLTTPAPTSE